MHTVDTLEIAKNKPTKQSSSDHFIRHSQNAVNGDYTQWMSSSTEFCSETINANEPSWWTVDLGAIYDISNVVIFGRTDCCGMFYITYLRKKSDEIVGF